MKAYCGLSRRQAALYEQAVEELARTARNTADGIQRAGIVLAYLMRLKQICNHPRSGCGDNGYEPADSGKFQRLREICEELAERQEKVLVFTQFREITEPLAEHPGGRLRPARAGAARRDAGGQAARDWSRRFRTEDGPPFFMLSLKAGGTGLNLTAAIARHPLRPLVEPGRREPGHRPRLPHRPEAQRPGAQIHLPRHG